MYEAIPQPFALFLGDSRDPKAIKTARGIYEWNKTAIYCQIAMSNQAEMLPQDINTYTGMDAFDHSGIVHAKTFVIATGAPGNQTFDDSWMPYIRMAISMGMNIANPLHTRLNQGVLKGLADKRGVKIFDFRYNDHLDIPVGKGVTRSGYRLLTVGQDSNIGKKYTSKSIHNVYKELGPSAFRPTGQTGRLLVGPNERSIVMDTMPADYMTGAAEWLSPAADDPTHLDIIEGQGSLDHPSFGPGALALLYGSQPDFLVMCVDATRKQLRGTQYAPSSLAKHIDLVVQLATRTNLKARLVGLSVKTSSLNNDQIDMYNNIMKGCQVAHREDITIFDPNDRDGVKKFCIKLRERIIQRQRTSTIDAAQGAAQEAFDRDMYTLNMFKQLNGLSA